MTAAPQFRVKCRRCSHWRNPREFVHSAELGYCWYCYEHHAKVLEILAGSAMPDGCQGCNRTHEQLEALAGTPDVRYGFHVKDGIYQMLGVACGCDRAYIAKRDDLYGRTPFAKQQQ